MGSTTSKKTEAKRTKRSAADKAQAEVDTVQRLLERNSKALDKARQGVTDLETTQSELQDRLAYARQHPALNRPAPSEVTPQGQTEG